MRDFFRQRSAILGFALGVVVSLGAPGPGLAQEALQSAARDFAGRWTAGEAPALTGLMDSSGVRLQVVDRKHGTLSPRQAVVALKEFLGRYRSVGVSLDRVSEVGGEPARGFAELRWQAAVLGATESAEYTVYVGFVNRARGWRVTEVRILR